MFGVGEVEHETSQATENGQVLKVKEGVGSKGTDGGFHLKIEVACLFIVSHTGTKKNS